MNYKDYQDLMKKYSINVSMSENATNALKNYIMWMHWYNDVELAMEAAGDFIETEKDLDELSFALKQLNRIDMLEKLTALLPEMDRIDCMKCMVAYGKKYGERVDWHEFSPMLEKLYNDGVLRMVKPGGMIGYALNKDN